MNKLGIETIKQDKVEISVDDIDTGFIISISGDIDMEDPGILLDPIFNKAHEGMLSNKLKSIILDLKKLAFLNSSGIKAIAKWIMKLSEIPDNKGYSIRILYDKATTWQVTSLPTLTFLVPGVVTLD